MYRRKIGLYTQEEFQHLKQQLEGLEIPYISHSPEDTNFVAINTVQTYWELSIPEEFSQKLFKQMDKDIQTEIYETKDSYEDGEDSFRFWGPKTKRSLLMLYAIIMTLLFLRYLQLNYQVSNDKNFSYSWTLDNSQQSAQHKDIPGFRTIFSDENYDLNFERTEVFSNNKRVAVYIDKDENGIQEKVVEYSLNGEKRSIAYDTDQDGLFDEWEMFDEEGNMTVYKDRDKDGFYDLPKQEGLEKKESLI